ncbi:DUF4755 domain-containing protein [Massilia sp. TWP1-3-3]|uniref:DUF4755 domain-containing protein n=1 Tax=Massilia sp. TWP1-3-3 TaxID=2804573 RepID=UPI003CED6BBF
MGFLAVITVLWGTFWSFGIKFATGFDGKLGTAALAWGPAVLLAWFVIGRALRREKLHDAALESLGVAKGAGFDHSEDGTGIAINVKSRAVALVGDGGFKTYGYEQLRSWVDREERPTGVVVGTVQGAAHNVRASREAAANTGLFVTVKDVERPEWRVAMKDRMARARWMELLRQQINETPASGASITS